MTEKRRRGRPRSLFHPADPKPVQSLDRALRLLAFVAEGDGRSLSEVAEGADLATSTAYRMLTTLAAHGIVEFADHQQLWSVGVEAYRIGSAFLRSRKLVDRARLVMQDLMERTGETANLGVAEERCVIFVSQVETHQAIRAFFRPGTRSPFHASGIGKAILAHLSKARVEAILEETGLEAFTDKTLSRPQLASDLNRIRTRGWAIDDEERHLGMRCVAAAIFNEFAEPLGGISISGPTVRLPQDRLPLLGQQVTEAAEQITKITGGVAPECR